jgi:hypothetical protein
VIDVKDERTSHRKAAVDPEAVEADRALHAHLPLSFQRPNSQAEEHYVHVKRTMDPAGKVISEEPIQNRKQRRTADALERRKFKPATRKLNKLELRELYLNKYEDSLEKAGIKTSQPRKKKKYVSAHVSAPALEPEHKPAADNSRLRDLARRATERALQAVGL